jgi:hypothetical protein
MKKITKKSLISFLILLTLLILLIVVYILYFIVYKPLPTIEGRNGWSLFWILTITLNYSFGFVLVITTISFMQYINTYKKNTNYILRLIFSILTILVALITAALYMYNIAGMFPLYSIISLSVVLTSSIVIYFISPISFLRRIGNKSPSKTEQIEKL